MHRLNDRRAKTLLLWISILAMLLALSACQQAPPAPPDTRAADEAAIRTMNADFQKIFLPATDAAKLTSFYTEDVVALSATDPVVQGKADLQKWFEGAVQQKGRNEFTIEKLEVARSGDQAYQWGRGTFTVQDKQGKPVEMKFKYVAVLKKQADGSWKFAVDTLIPEPAPKADAKPAK